MTSVDSGVETGNDSNDSLVAQHENIPVGQASGSTSTFVSTTGNQMEDEENENDTISIVPVSRPLRLPIASICPGLENCTTSTNNSPHNLGAGTSGPLALCPNSVQVSSCRILIVHISNFLFNQGDQGYNFLYIKEASIFEDKH